MRWNKRKSSRKSLGVAAGALALLAVAVLASAFPALAQAPGGPVAPTSQSASPAIAAPASPASPPLDPDATGSIVGTVVDQSGTPVFGAHVVLKHQGQSAAPTADSDDDGQFFFSNVPPGPFQLSISAADFDSKMVSDVLQPGEYHTLPKIALVLAPVVTQVVVKPVSVIAAEQLKQQERQRVLGVVPNFYVTYIPNAAPLDHQQKFQLAWKSTLDPVTVGIAAAFAGIQQMAGQYSGYGTGAEGYSKRFGAAYANIAIGTFLGDAVFPSLFKQDPRYFYKGTGSVHSRILYAIANAVICKGNNGHWQPDYSMMLGQLAAGGISNLYYPPQDRNGVALTFESAAIGVAATAADNLLQEFVIRKLTPKLAHMHADPGPTHP
jgi:hypothetical protein